MRYKIGDKVVITDTYLKGKTAIIETIHPTVRETYYGLILLDPQEITMTDLNGNTIKFPEHNDYLAKESDIIPLGELGEVIYDH